MTRNVKSKIPAMIAMAVSSVSFVLVLIALVVSILETPPETGNSYSFGLWVFSLMAAIVSIVFYLIDAILMIDDLYHTPTRLLAIAVIAMAVGSIPMFVFVGASLGINIRIWNLYYAGMFVLQIFS
ncbi:MAG: hypothetical protein IKM46_08885, partial [Clostridia bacterium]|nr:hypothetical protein [Clostridia bacterium]